MRPSAKLALSLIAVALVAMLFAFVFFNSPTYVSETNVQFSQFVKDHNKVYFNQDEFNYRAQVFRQNEEFIAKINQKSLLEDGEDGVVLKMNQFGDMTHQEFKRYYLSAKVPENRKRREFDINKLDDDFVEVSVDDLPPSIDWDEKGHVTSVKNQGYCGSCWAFATIAAIESMQSIKGQVHHDLSEQQLVDCTNNNDVQNFGCNGGWLQNTYQYIAEHGLMDETDYPYEAYDGACQYSRNKVSVQTEGVSELIGFNEIELMQAVAQQPVSVAIDASHMQFYSMGVMPGWFCSPDNLNHAVTIVGYGKTWYQMNYWKFKNSWGPGWGQDGFGKVRRTHKTNTEGVCGIAMYPSHPV